MVTVKEHADNSEFRPRLDVVSPFLDKRHGTERCVTEQIERLANHFEIHLYSTAVQDMDLSRITWHRVPRLPGPLLFSYCWWVTANHLWRWWDARFRNLAPAMVYSPGINCFDADVISVHVVFGAYLSQAGEDLKLSANRVRLWPRLLHRRIYYRLIVTMERVLYASDHPAAAPSGPNQDTPGKRQRAMVGFTKPLLTAISTKAAKNLQRYGKAESEIPVIRHGVDSQRFNLAVRQLLRESARQALGLGQDDFSLLLVGNDWRNKGLPCLLEALGKLRKTQIRLLVVGTDAWESYRETITQLRLEGRVTFLPVRSDVEFYYAAADLYVGPSLEDAFSLPPLEAMACGVPAIVSSQAGVSEIIEHGRNGFVLDDPRDSSGLAALIAMLYEKEALRQEVAESAAATARNHNWESNARQLCQLFQEVLRRKHPGRAFSSGLDQHNQPAILAEAEKPPAALAVTGVP